MFFSPTRQCKTGDMKLMSPHTSSRCTSGRDMDQLSALDPGLSLIKCFRACEASDVDMVVLMYSSKQCCYICFVDVFAVDKR